jgi:hypothetical protein
VDDVDLLKGSVRVQRQLDEHGAVQPLKYPASYRTLPLREVVSLELAAHLAAHGGGPGPVFRGHYGQPVRDRQGMGAGVGSGRRRP